MVVVVVVVGVVVVVDGVVDVVDVLDVLDVLDVFDVVVAHKHFFPLCCCPSMSMHHAFKFNVLNADVGFSFLST